MDFSDMNPVAWLQRIYNTLSGIWKVVAAVGGLAIALGQMVWAFVDLEAGLVGLANSIDLLASALQGLPTHAVMGYVNRIFPLSEYFALLIGWYSFLLVCIVIRWIRSFIPTMGG